MMRRWLVAVAVAAAAAGIGVLSFGLLAEPAGGVGATLSTTTVTDDAAGVVTGGTFTFTAAVTPSSPTPTGTLTWGVTGPSAATCVPSTLDANGDGTCIVMDAEAGTYSATATYSGDTNYAGGTGSDSTATVGKATSTTAVTDNAAGVVTGGTFTFTAAVTGPGVTPTGTLTWVVTGPTAVACSTSTLDSSGRATCIVTGARPGTYSATATYGSDTNYNGSSGSDTKATVGPATPTPPTISNLPSSGTYGGSFNATVTGTNSLGTLSVTSNSTSVCSVSNSLTVTYVGAGTCSLTAQVAASTDYVAASGAPQTFGIGRAVPTTPAVTNIPTNAVEFAGFTAVVGTTGDGTTSVASTTPGTCTIGPDGLTVFFVSEGACTLVPSVAPGANYFGATGSPQTFSLGPAPRGYWLVGSDGGIFSFGAAAFHGSMGGMWLQRPVVGITPTLTRGGYWLVASDGGIFSFGDASFYGSIPGLGLHPAGSGLPNSLNAPVVGVVPTVTRHGYFMVASDGGVFAFGDARFEGSCPGIGGCAGTAVAVMPDQTGKGYWLVTSTGDVYAFGDATFYGTPPPDPIPVVDAVATPDGHGYWLLYANGAVTPFGDAANLGEPAGYVNSFNPATSIFPTADGKGYWVATARGDVFSYGNAPYLGSESDAGLNGEIIAGFGF